MRLDGTTATAVGLHERTGEQADHYNLTVSELHTYAVGAGQFVVHNCTRVVGDPEAIAAKGDSNTYFITDIRTRRDTMR
jgi:hypothetical protein